MARRAAVRFCRRKRVRRDLRAYFSHLWTHPILLDGRKYTARFGAIPLTPLADAIATTLEWHRAHPELRLQA